MIILKIKEQKKILLEYDMGSIFFELLSDMVGMTFAFTFGGILKSTLYNELYLMNPALFISSICLIILYLLRNVIKSKGLSLLSICNNYNSLYFPYIVIFLIIISKLRRKFRLKIIYVILETELHEMGG